MARHLAAFYDSIQLTALTPINAVPDTQVYTTGTNLRVPPDLNMLSMASSLYFGTAINQAQIETPSLRVLANYDVSPLNLTTYPTQAQNFADLYDSPKQLDGNEQMTFSIDGTAGGAVDGYGIIELTDGKITPVSGDIFTVRATGAATLVAGSFVNTGVIFDTVLPAGNYNVVGFKAEGANLVAARIAFVGAPYRPGVLGDAASYGTPNLRFRHGNAGVFGNFNINQPPTVDCLGITDTAQVFYFDLIKTK